MFLLPLGRSRVAMRLVLLVQPFVRVYAGRLLTTQALDPLWRARHLSSLAMKTGDVETMRIMRSHTVFDVVWDVNSRGCPCLP
jgi:hypothetical protein